MDISEKDLGKIKTEINSKSKKWDYRALELECLKYEYLIDFQNMSTTAYCKCIKYNLIPLIGKHLKRRTKPNGYWTKERCVEKANLYDNHNDFKLYDISAESTARRLGIYKEITKHFITKSNRIIKWTYEACKEEALKYDSKKEFISNSASAYGKICSKNWMDELCSHMEQGGNRFMRFLYAYEFPDRHVYVGLTYKPSKRKRGHKEDGAVFEHINKTKSEPVFKLLTEEAVSPEEAIKLENYYLNYYKDSGWTPLNKAKTGSLGGNVVKWSFEKCQEKALLYQTRTKFCRAEGSAYSAALRNNWIDDICSHMTSIRKPSSYWTFENCRKEALKYERKVDFSKNSSGAYSKAYSEKWLDKICSHMPMIKATASYYTFDKCKELVSNYSDFQEFRTNNSKVYSAILKNCWQDELYKDLNFKKKRKGFWTLEECVKVAKNCRTVKEYRENYGTAYNNVFKNKWYNQIKENFIKDEL